MNLQELITKKQEIETWVKTPGRKKHPRFFEGLRKLNEVNQDIIRIELQNKPEMVIENGRLRPVEDMFLEDVKDAVL